MFISQNGTTAQKLISVVFNDEECRQPWPFARQRLSSVSDQKICVPGTAADTAFMVIIVIIDVGLGCETGLWDWLFGRRWPLWGLG